MNTILYLVRHAESPYIAGMELERGLSPKGQQDAERVKLILHNEKCDHFYSSPYERAISTIRPLAEERGQDIQLIDDLRERTIGDIAGTGFYEAKHAVYKDFTFSFPGGESSATAQKRAVRVVEQLLSQHAGDSIVIGTHGDIMTLLLNHFDRLYGFDFWQSASMPDLYKAEFSGLQLNRVTREWSGQS
ncbi:phosphoglycerate mutase [Paenibacillus sp. FSL R7-0273]|uniref:histidine phosphatase family protein n=1 Tax=Paenibacillus sp. FSL R7-0273 TaxID=1536772 RepID=UPI0004F81225|nr:histidine phosphatase family protein [Paenibacillus sp. FSL R7-0273]AIQ49479.1 phosphoglycerate mutase [Paenibacillus sp. FSL R7-0273]OMF89680.1 histidine phosphatase family protein [Paenibacillus sp. FSL R7-0273]